MRASPRSVLLVRHPLSADSAPTVATAIDCRYSSDIAVAFDGTRFLVIYTTDAASAAPS